MRTQAEEPLIEPLAHLGLTAPRILDLGGHMGQFAIMARTVWPDSYVVSVEANAGVLDDLERFAHEVHNVLLFDEDGVELTYWMRNDDAYGGSTGNSVFRENTGFFSDLEVLKGNVRRETRTTVALETLLAGPDPFQLVKLDLQGAELKAIEGGLRTILQADAILCEQQRVEYNCGAPMHGDVDRAIRRLGVDSALDKNKPDAFRLVWESDHEIVGQMQVDRLYVKVGSEVDLRMRMETVERAGFQLGTEEAA
jgi:FkbM family methyltransferase